MLEKKSLGFGSRKFGLEKSICFGFGKFGLGNEVSVSVSENLVSEKSLGFGNLVSKNSLGFGFVKLCLRNEKSK